MELFFQNRIQQQVILQLFSNKEIELTRGTEKQGMRVYVINLLPVNKINKLIIHCIFSSKT